MKSEATGSKERTPEPALSAAAGVGLGIALVLVVGAVGGWRLLGRGEMPTADLFLRIALAVLVIAALVLARQYPSTSIWAGLTTLILVVIAAIRRSANEWADVPLWDLVGLWVRASGTVEAPLLGVILVATPLIYRHQAATLPTVAGSTSSSATAAESATTRG